jgi:hypothetical protein
VFRISAQENFSYLKYKKILDIEIDYSNARISDWDAADFFLRENHNNPNYEYLYKKKMFELFVENCNRHLPYECKIIKGDPNAEYKMTVKIRSVDSDDGAASATITITKIESDEVLSTFNAYGKGDRWEPFFDLSQYGFEHLGDDVGRHITKVQKKIDRM